MTPRPGSDTHPSRTRRPTPEGERPLRRRSGSDQDLIADLKRLEGRNYGSYKSVVGDWDYGDFTLALDRIQSDPYAPPSSLRVSTTPQQMGLPADTVATSAQRLATADFLVRVFAAAITRV